MKNNRISFSFLIVDFVLIVLSAFMGKFWLLNTQVAFICSTLITLASFYSYKRSINKRIDMGDNGIYKDSYDELEDPYNLFEEEADKKEKQAKKKGGAVTYVIKGFASGIGGALNIYRIVAYGILIVSFLYLNRHNLFNPIPFFLGLSVVPIASLMSNLSSKSKQS
jgi:hypothetical protein